MKTKLLALLFAAAFTSGAMAQTEFAPLGATWYYSVADESGNPLSSYEKYVSTADTLINGKTCRVVASVSDTLIFYNENGKVYNWFQEHFLLTYDFCVKPGDTIAIDFRANKPNGFAIDTFFTVQCAVKKVNTLGDSHLKHFELDMIPRNDLSDYNFGTYSYIENIGYEYVPMYEFTNLVSPGITIGKCYLRCYEDGMVNYTTDWWKSQSLPCDYSENEHYHLHHFLPDSAQFWSCDELNYIIAGDTVINGKKMKKVYESSLKYYYAAIYEDTLNAKYSVVYENSTEEKLFMDFSVKKGDKVVVSDELETKEVIVVDVSFDEKGRKVVETEWTRNNIADVWVEGIGSACDVLFTGVTLYGIADIDIKPLARIIVRDSVIYERITAEICDKDREISINDTKSNANISIYPNPPKDFLLINAENLECCTYEIVSTSGAVLQSGELLPSIDINHLASGLKLLIVKDDNGTVIYSGRFVKD